MSAPSWWPLDDGPYPLLDGWMDGWIEERCWVPVNVVDGDEYAEQRAAGGRMAAIEAFLRRTLDYAYEHLAEDHSTLVLAEGVTWQRPTAKLDADGTYVEATDDPCDDHEDEGCPRCRGTGTVHIVYDEGCPWQACGEGDEGAVAFYVLDVVEADVEAGAA